MTEDRSRNMPPLLYEKKDAIAYITLNRPDKHNAIDPEMAVRLADAWQDYNHDDALRVAIITGAGDRAFSPGADRGVVDAPAPSDPVLQGHGDPPGGRRHRCGRGLEDRIRELRGASARAPPEGRGAGTKDRRQRPPGCEADQGDRAEDVGCDHRDGAQARRERPVPAGHVRGREGRAEGVRRKAQAGVSRAVEIARTGAREGV